MSENGNDFLANNNGIVKTKKGLVLTIIGILGFIVYLGVVTVLTAIPNLQWLGIALVGLLFFAAGIIFLAMSQGTYNLPLFAMMIGVLIMYVSITEKFFMSVREGLGDKATGGIMIAFAILMLLFPLIAVKYYKSKYTVSVDATVIHVEHKFSRTSRGHHAITYRPIYEFTYMGKEYDVTDKLYRSGKHPSTGEERELLIDGNKPERFVDIERIKERSIGSYVGPIIVLAVGIYLVVAG